MAQNNPSELTKALQKNYAEQFKEVRAPPPSPEVPEDPDLQSKDCNTRIHARLIRDLWQLNKRLRVLEERAGITSPIRIPESR